MHGTLLTLSPAFGGTTFGPFPPGSVLLGSDPGRCHITLHAGFGAMPVHATVTPSGDGRSFVLQPVEPGAALFLAQGGRVTPVRSAVTLSAGAQFVIGSPTGPCFTVTPAAGPAVAAPTPRRGPRSMPTADAMGREVKRQAGAALYAGPLGEIRDSLYRVKSGAILHPRVVVGALVALAGAAFAGCSGLVAFVLHQV